MNQIFQDIKKHTILIWIAGFVILILFFESAQQYYYINRYQIIENPSFLDILKNQCLSWLIWIAFALLIIPLTSKNAFKQRVSIGMFVSYIVISFLLTAITIATIALLRMLLNGGESSLYLYFTEYLPFFTFQKSPIYTLGFLSMSAMFHYYFENQKLKVDVLELAELKEMNLKLSDEIKQVKSNDTKILRVKVGNQQKIIPVKNITWIEADDYCSKIHTDAKKSYSMRISLKALEDELGSDFLRVHRSAIANMKKIKEIKGSSPHKLVLQNQELIPLAKSKLSAVNEYLHSISVLAAKS